MAEEYSHLPEELEAIGIEDLQNGETAYTVPWSVWVKMDKSAFINGHFPFTAEARGTLSMLIKRRGDDVLVDMSTLEDHKFSRSEFPPHMGAKPEDYLPVKFVRKI